jgi:COMPASS component SWD1
VDENVKYEEREDEFDIVRLSLHLYSFHPSTCLGGLIVDRWLQEDESEIAQRKTKEEEQFIDIGGDGDEGREQAAPVPLSSARQSISRSQSQRATPAPGTPVPVPGSVTGNGEAAGEDLTWAEDDPDDDLSGWKLKIVLEDERDQMRY